METATKRQKNVGFTNDEWEALKKRRREELAATRGSIKLREPGTMKEYFSFTRPKNGKVYQFSAN